MKDRPFLQNVTRRQLLEAGAMTGMAAALGRYGAIAPAQAASSQIVFGTVGGAWLEGIKKIFIEDTGFDKENDAEIVWDAQSDAALITKSLASCGDPIYSLLQANAPGAARLTEAGCILPYDPQIVTHLSNIDDTYKSGDTLVATIRLISGLIYNTEHVKTKPTGWVDLMNPEYKGKVGVPQYGWLGPQFLHAINKAEGGDEDNIDPGIAASAKIVRDNDAVIVQHSNLADQLFRQGEIWIMPFWTGRMINLKASGLPVDIYYQEHFFSVDIGYVVPKGPQAELAQKLINVTLEPEVQLNLLKHFKYQPTNRNVVIPDDLKDAVLPDYAKDRAAQIDWIKVNKHADRDLERWNREVLG
jgi:putative spermidine/putrescine transport system substrate-binding protein